MLMQLSRQTTLWGSSGAPQFMHVPESASVTTTTTIPAITTTIPASTSSTSSTVSGDHHVRWCPEIAISKWRFMQLSLPGCDERNAGPVPDDRELLC